MKNTPLGSTVTDIITGFKGIVTARVEYLSGCNQVLVAPKVGKDGASKEPEWFDEQRITIAKTPAIKLDNGNAPGCDRQAPKR